MRFIHTADWHLGKNLKGHSLIDDQAHILREFLKLVDDAKPEAVIVAGDIYDRGVPPVEAINLFDEVIFKLAEKKIPVLCISGNHDNAARLNFGSRLLKQTKFFIVTRPEENLPPVILQDKFGEIYFSLIPFCEPIEIQNKFAPEISERLTSDETNKIYLAAERKKIPNGRRSVAVAHLFATGGKTSESERKIVGTLDNVDAANFSGYNYTALGHLHKPQNMAKSNNFVRYSGSILKYSFDEANFDKGVTLVDIDGAGEISAEHVNLIPLHDVKIFSGTLKELLEYPKTHDYIHAELADKKYVLDAVGKLREAAFPNILSIRFAGLEKAAENHSDAQNLREGVSTLEYFADFFEHETNEKLEGDYRAAMEEFLKELETQAVAD